jgi:hypothetical protein
MQIFGKTDTIAHCRCKRNKLTVSAVLVLLAIGGGFGIAQDVSSHPTGPSEGDRLMDRAARRLAEWPSLGVRLRQRVTLYGQEAVGSGVYMQQQTSRGLLLRMELKLQVAGRLTTLQQICDGRFLWVRSELPDSTSLGRVDLARLRDAAQQAGNGPPTDWASGNLALGGLPRLMSSLRDHFQFGAPEPGQSEQAQMWVVEGQWKPVILAKLLPGQVDSLLAGSAPDLTGLPPHLPSHIRVVLCQEDLFPLQIDFRRSGGESHNGSTATVDDAASILVMEFYSIRRGEDLDQRYFVYQPGEQEVVDLTDRYLQRLMPPPEEGKIED